MSAQHFLTITKRTAIKCCGITNSQDALSAVECGADAIGMVFYPPAAVCVDVATAKAIMQSLPPPVCGVALFVNASAAQVREVADVVRPHLLQFHGDEDVAFCTSFGLPYIKACRVATADDIRATSIAHRQAAAILADNPSGGGSGKVFDWDLLPRQISLPLIIAGGLAADNVGDVVRRFAPLAVDVSGGIAEVNNRRRKNCGKMRAFIEAVRAADDNR